MDGRWGAGRERERGGGMDFVSWLEGLPGITMEKLYASHWACQAALRGLPPLAKLYVLRLLYLESPVPASAPHNAVPLRPHTLIVIFSSCQRQERILSAHGVWQASWTRGPSSMARGSMPQRWTSSRACTSCSTVAYRGAYPILGHRCCSGMCNFLEIQPAQCRQSSNASEDIWHTR